MVLHIVKGNIQEYKKSNETARVKTSKRSNLQILKVVGKGAESSSVGARETSLGRELPPRQLASLTSDQRGQHEHPARPRQSAITLTDWAIRAPRVKVGTPGSHHWTGNKLGLICETPNDLLLLATIPEDQRSRKQGYGRHRCLQSFRFQAWRTLQ